jgi:hypothetical protein
METKSPKLALMTKKLSPNLRVTAGQMYKLADLLEQALKDEFAS